jgi:signal transduction histidine kinase
VQADRRRLAVELHDSVGALLFAIGAGLRGLESEPGLHPRLRSRLAALEQQTSDASATLRLSLQTLDVAPQDLELAVALRRDCHSFEDRTGVSARLVLLSETPALSDVQTRALSQSVREALLNVEKHAHARSVVVTLSAQRHGVLVVVADDGAGPEPKRRRRSDGLGLRAIADRLARLGGTTMLRRNEDGGATLRLWLPS